MGDIRFTHVYERVRQAKDLSRVLSTLTDEEVIGALAASAEGPPYLANVLATEAHNRTRRASAITRHLGEGVVTADRNGRVNLVNPACERLLGWDREAILGRPLHATLHPFCPGGCALEEVFETGRTEQNDSAMFARADGRTLAVAYTVSPIYDSDTITGALVVFRDMTEAKRAEERTHETEDRLERIVDSLTEGILITDREGRFTFSNPAAERILGRSRRDITSRTYYDPIWDLTDAEGAPIPITDMPPLKVLRDGRTIEGLILGFRRSDGHRRLVEGTFVPLRNALGAVSGALMSFYDVTARLQAQAQQAELAAIVQSSDDAILSISPDGCITSWNPGAERLFGYHAEEALGERPSFLLAPRHRAEEQAATERVLRGERVLHRELEGLTKDGRTLYLSLSLSPLLAPSGEVVGASAIYRDITTEKRSERQLKEQAQILDLANDTIIIRNLHDRITYWNRGAERLYGWREEEVRGKRIHKVLKTEFPEALDRLREVLLAQGTWAGELVHVCRDGSRVVVASQWTLQRDEDGEPKAILEINHDITEQKRTDRELRESEERYRSLFDNSPDGIYKIDLEGRFVALNPACEEIGGYRREEVIGRAFWEIVVPEDRDASIEAYRQALRGVPTAATLRIVCKNGSVARLRVTKVPMKSRGRIVGVFGVAQDITEQTQAEADLRERDAQLSAIIEHAGIGICLSDMEGRIVHCNPALQRLLGYEHEELCGMHFTDITHPDDVEQEWALFQELVDGARDTYRMEKRYLTKEGAVVNGTLTASIVRGPGNEPRYVVRLVEELRPAQRVDRPAAAGG